MVNCLECNAEFADDAHLHKHLRKHGFDMTIYYRKFFPRHDRLTGDLIRFVHKEQYLSAEFNSPENFKKWLTSQPVDAARDYCRNMLFERKEKKGLLYTPSQVELRSLGGPSMHFLSKIFNYYQVCAELGFTNKYQLLDKIPNNDTPYFIQIDTRERNPLPFVGATFEKLDYGDYKIYNNEQKFAVYFERKALGDFVGTLSTGYARFKRELERAAADKNYLIIVVESQFNDAMNFNKLDKKSFTTKTTPAYIFHNVRSLIQEFPNISFLFVHGRDVARKVMVRIFQMGEVYKKCDHQWLYDTNRFNS